MLLVLIDESIEFLEVEFLGEVAIIERGLGD